MDFETALTIVNTVMAAQGHTLSEAELALLKGAWHGQTYEVITEESSYTSSYLTRVIGPRFWKHLSEALGQQVSKTSFRAAIAQAQSANTQLITAQSTSAPPPTPPDLPRPQLDWGEAPDVATFYGRQQELDTLRRWALGETASGRHKPCRLGSILGMGGMGKTALSARFVEMLLDQPDCPFTHIIWRSLRNAPTLKELLAELIPFVSSQQETEATARRLMHWLRQSRCLLILDNLETILQGGSHAGYFRPDYEDYGELLRQVAETRHQSTVLLTSREKPAIVGTLEGVDPSVQSLQLSGSPEAAQALLAGRGLTGTAAQQRQLGERYNYSPLALKIVATSIQSVFDGDIGLFLAEDTLVFNGLQRLLEQQFARLTALEQQVMGWLAVNREWTSIPSLIEDIKPSVSRSQLLTALESLHWRSLIETASLAQGIGYTQQPVVMEYVTSRLIRQIVEELSTGELDALLRYPLLKTTVKDYVRLSQRRLILQPVATQLKKTLDTQATLKRRLGEVLTQLRQQPTFTGYAIGNLLNLCLHLKLAIADLDFSEAVIHHAYLQGETLQGVSFAGATFVDAAFTQTFGNILAIAFAPDGQRLAASDTSGQVWVWQSSNLNHPYLRFQAHGDWVWSLAFSPDGQVLVSGSDDIDDTLKVWSAETGDHLRTLKAPNHQVRAVGWSADQTRLASSGVDGTVRIWDEAGNCLAVLTGHSNKTSALAWQPVAEGPGLLATGSSDETIKIWDVASGECLRDISVGDSVFAIAWSPDGQTLASGSKAGGIQLWRSQTGECLKRLEGHQNSIWSLDWSVSGALASGGDDCSIRLWNPETGQCLRVLQGHQNAVRSLHWQPTSTDHPNQAIDGARADLLASGSFDQTVRLWSSRADASLKVLQGYRNSILAVAWHPDGRLASGGQDGLVRVWDPKTGDCLMALAGHNRPVWAIACSRGGILASGGDDQTIRLWDLQTQRPVATLKGHQDTIWGLAWHPLAAVVASASHDQTVRLWEADTGRCLQVLTGHQHFVRAIAWSPNGKLLASGSYDQTLRLWDAETGHCLRVLRDAENWVWQMAFSPDSRTLATSSTTGDINLWDVATGELQRTLKGHPKSVWGLCWRPDGQTLISSSHDHTIRVWNAPDGRCLQILEGHTDLVWHLAPNPEGTLAASCGADETIRLWDVVAGTGLKVLRPMRPYEGMNITAVQGLTPAQQQNLEALGATVTALKQPLASGVETHPQATVMLPVAPTRADGDGDSGTSGDSSDTDPSHLQSPLVIRLLGSFGLTYRGQPLPTTMAGRSQSLLAYLLLHPTLPQSRQQIAAALWPESLEGQSRTNLRKELHHLRRYLPEADQYLQVDSTTLSWRQDAPVWLDVTAFKQALAAEGAGVEAAIAHRQQAIDLYQGDLLPPLYDEWLAPHRDRLRQQFLQALAQLVDGLLQQHDYAAALLQAQRLLQQDPLREATYQALMQIHAGLGDRAAALQVYHQCMAVLRDELGIDPSSRTQQIYGALLD